MVQIRLTNTKTRRKEVFEPIDPTNVRMYVCGPTVYDRAHLGNARPVVVFDVLFRLLRHVYGEGHVTYVRNFTDVDDKINARAAETGRPIREITDETIGWFHEDMDALGALRPTQEPRATEWIGAMVAMIEGLVARGHAYEAEGHVLFRVRSYAEYGALSGRLLDDMIAGARVEVAPFKEDPLDFVLWKPSTDDLPGWASPWGRGRPGWHIECSAMARELLGPSFDIHGGGLDLQFPHHENEIAQSMCAHPGEGFAQVWMHNEMVLVDGQKMSKSLGNFLTINEMLRVRLGREDFVLHDRNILTERGNFLILPRLSGHTIRLALMMSHHQSKLDWTFYRAKEADRVLKKLDYTLRSSEIDFYNFERALPPRLIEILSDDLNTPEAIAYLQELADGVRRKRAKGEVLLACMNFLGLTSRVQIERLQINRALEKFSEGLDAIFSLRLDPYKLLGAIEDRTPSETRWRLRNIGRWIADGNRNFSTDYPDESFQDFADPAMLPEERDSILSHISSLRIAQMLRTRENAKRDKDFIRADRIRQELEDFNIELIDTAHGPRWRSKG